MYLFASLSVSLVLNIFNVDQWSTVLRVNPEEPQTTSITNQFFPTLFVGESPYGLYAIEALVDHETITTSPKLVGPPLLEGPAPIALTDVERDQYRPPQRQEFTGAPQSITFKFQDGEYLLLGYHDRPPMVMATIIPTRYPVFPFRNALESQERPQLTGPIEPHKKPEDTSIIVLLINQYPYPFFGAIMTMAALLLTVIWQCGRQWDRNSNDNLRMESFEVVNSPGESKGAQTSKNGSFGRGSFGWTQKKIEIPDGWMAVGSKLMYSPSDILGTGCEGTVVYRGTFDGREVAVKRVVSEFVKFAHREADLLRESDHHPHVIRYFCMESDSQFRYLALELCIASLNDYVEQKELQENVSLTLKEILSQATDGLAHLHASKIVHRDMKPQNVLITTASQRGKMRAVISDFGLCKRVQPGKNSISRGIASGLAGTDGWIAPEVLISASTSYPVDIFSLGCIFYYVLSSGTHPFGKSLHRQANIVNGDFSLAKLAEMEDWSLADDLITTMLHVDPIQRLTAEAVLNHPFFWNAEKRLAYFSDVSDRVEKEEDNSPVCRRIEQDARVIVCGGWREKICDALKEDLRKFRTYKSHSVRDLLRAMRNKKHHYRELPEEVRTSLGDIPDQFLHYFTSRFPRLLLHVYKATEYCSAEPVFRRYYSDAVRSRMQPIVDEEERIRREIKEEMADKEWVRQPKNAEQRQNPDKRTNQRKNNNKKNNQQ
ncbi:CBN-IRE-1 protein [Caenorhabditis brenneri]|uniref:non-specific serine/threonine protein kinase n=1 Tax=Caenorhabditis brenneri TaxID=135651 RepID=G0NY76_CAEBE|nr:CBN-IRE-1 protein [Caenorhabditis brenneri]